MRLYAILLAALLALSAGLYYSLSTLFTERSEHRATTVLLDEQKRHNEALLSAMASVKVEVQEVQQKASAHRQELDNAIKENRPWADTPVPGAIRDGLCKQVKCKSSSSSVQASGS